MVIEAKYMEHQTLTTKVLSPLDYLSILSYKPDVSLSALILGPPRYYHNTMLIL